jgi:hypothetical protein
MTGVYVSNFDGGFDATGVAKHEPVESENFLTSLIKASNRHEPPCRLNHLSGHHILNPWD